MPDGSNRNPFTTTAQLSLADILSQLETDTELAAQRRRNLCSAIRSLGKLMNEDLQHLPAHPGFYRPLFKNLHPERCGLTKSRISNIKSNVLFALRHIGCIQGARTYLAPMTEAWLSREDQDGRLAAFLKPSLTASELTTAQVEGWILGVA